MCRLKKSFTGLDADITPLDEGDYLVLEGLDDREEKRPHPVSKTRPLNNLSPSFR